MKIKALRIGLTAGMFLLSPLPALAQPSDTPAQRPFLKMIQELNLTQDQKTKLKALRQQMKEPRQQIIEQMKGIRKKIKEELLKDKPLKSALDGYASQLGDLSKQIAQKLADHLLQVKAVLTPEQFAKLVNHDWMGQFMKQRGQGKNHPGAEGEMDEM
jgi:Spy/CpxP family protein refolding chaperone